MLIIYHHFQFFIYFKPFSAFLNASCKLRIAWISRDEQKNLNLFLEPQIIKIQKEFRERLGLLVDMPGDSRTSND